MNKIIILLACIFISSQAQSQCNLAVGKSQINAGVGLSSWGLPVYVGFDYQIHKNISVGAEGSYRGYRETIYTVKYRHNIIGISGNGNYHFNELLNIPTKFDLYAGLNLGFYVWSSPSNYLGSSSSGIGLGGQVGGRYSLSKKVALNLELGGGNAFSGGKFGLTFKL